MITSVAPAASSSMTTPEMPVTAAPVLATPALLPFWPLLAPDAPGFAGAPGWLGLPGFVGVPAFFTKASSALNRAPVALLISS